MRERLKDMTNLYFDEPSNHLNRNNDNYDDDNNKSNNFISVQNRVKSLLNGEGGGERIGEKADHARIGTSLIMINTHYIRLEEYLLIHRTCTRIDPHRPFA